MSENGKSKLILTSFGLNTSVGRSLIGKQFAEDPHIGEKKIFVFHEPYYSLQRMMEAALLQMGFKKENIIFSGQQRMNKELLERGVDVVYVGEGNVFEIMSLLRERDLVNTIQEIFRRGGTYVGTSAGAMIAGRSIEPGLDFERDFVGMDRYGYDGLGLYEGIIIPHYTKAELKRYIKNSHGIEERYSSILSVANSRVLVLEV